MSDAPSIPVLPTHALCVYAEPLVAGRRVVVIDAADAGLAERVQDLGARIVHLYDPDAARAEEHAEHAPRGITVRPMPDGDFDVRDGAFDVAIVPDLGVLVEPAALLARLRRLVGGSGVALVAARSADVPSVSEGHASRALDYYELFDL